MSWKTVESGVECGFALELVKNDTKQQTYEVISS